MYFVFVRELLDQSQARITDPKKIWNTTSDDEYPWKIDPCCFGVAAATAVTTEIVLPITERTASKAADVAEKTTEKVADVVLPVAESLITSSLTIMSPTYDELMAMENENCILDDAQQKPPNQRSSSNNQANKALPPISTNHSILNVGTINTAASNKNMNANDSFVLDPYQILQVRKDSTVDEIRRSYQRLALLHHPYRKSCRNSHTNATPKDDEHTKKSLFLFTIITASYETLIAKESRARLDNLLYNKSWISAKKPTLQKEPATSSILTVHTQQNDSPIQQHCRRSHQRIDQQPSLTVKHSIDGKQESVISAVSEMKEVLTLNHSSGLEQTPNDITKSSIEASQEHEILTQELEAKYKPSMNENGETVTARAIEAETQMQNASKDEKVTELESIVLEHQPKSDILIEVQTTSNDDKNKSSMDENADANETEAVIESDFVNVSSPAARPIESKSLDVVPEENLCNAIATAFRETVDPSLDENRNLTGRESEILDIVPEENLHDDIIYAIEASDEPSLDEIVDATGLTAVIVDVSSLAATSTDSEIVDVVLEENLCGAIVTAVVEDKDEELMKEEANEETSLDQNGAATATEAVVETEIVDESPELADLRSTKNVEYTIVDEEEEEALLPYSKTSLPSASSLPLCSSSFMSSSFDQAVMRSAKTFPNGVSNKSAHLQENGCRKKDDLVLEDEPDHAPQDEQTFLAEGSQKSTSAVVKEDHELVSEQQINPDVDLLSASITASKSLLNSVVHDVDVAISTSVLATKSLVTSVINEVDDVILGSTINKSYEEQNDEEEAHSRTEQIVTLDDALQYAIVPANSSLTSACSDEKPDCCEMMLPNYYGDFDFASEDCGEIIDRLARVAVQEDEILDCDESKNDGVVSVDSSLSFQVDDNLTADLRYDDWYHLLCLSCTPPSLQKLAASLTGEVSDRELYNHFTNLSLYERDGVEQVDSFENVHEQVQFPVRPSPKSDSKDIQSDLVPKTIDTHVRPTSSPLLGKATEDHDNGMLTIQQSYSFKTACEEEDSEQDKVKKEERDAEDKNLDLFPIQLPEDNIEHVKSFQQWVEKRRPSIRDHSYDTNNEDRHTYSARSVIGNKRNRSSTPSPVAFVTINDKGNHHRPLLQGTPSSIAAAFSSKTMQSDNGDDEDNDDVSSKSTTTGSSSSRKLLVETGRSSSSNTLFNSETYIHYSSKETDQLFGGPLQVLYKARKFQPFTDPFELFEKEFQTPAFSSKHRASTVKVGSESKNNTSVSAYNCNTVNQQQGATTTATKTLSNKELLLLCQVKSFQELLLPSVLSSSSPSPILGRSLVTKERHVEPLIVPASTTNDNCNVNDPNDDATSTNKTTSQQMMVVVRTATRKFQDVDTAPLIQTTKATTTSKAKSPSTARTRDFATVNRTITRTTKTYRDPATGIVKTVVTVQSDEYRDNIEPSTAISISSSSNKKKQTSSSMFFSFFGDSTTSTTTTTTTTGTKMEQPQTKTSSWPLCCSLPSSPLEIESE